MTQRWRFEDGLLCGMSGCFLLDGRQVIFSYVKCHQHSQRQFYRYAHWPVTALMDGPQVGAMFVQVPVSIWRLWRARHRRKQNTELAQNL